MKKKKPEISKKALKEIEKGLADAKAGRVTTYDKTATSKVSVDFPICMDFFNDTGKVIHIRTTPWTHAKNPEVIPIRRGAKIYIQSGFLKLWDEGHSFRLLVE
jgi:hypothetical protein